MPHRNHSLRAGLLAMAAVFTSAPALADSYVYITNSTPEPVSVQINHYGDDTLNEGNEWQREAQEIAPYATARVLAFNRYEGLKSGRTYYFDTQVTGASSTVTLQQKMRGTWYGSRIEHSAEGADFQAPWADDRDIHRYDSQYDARASRVGFKAQYTGGYDDFYYTIHNQTQAEPLSGDDALKVLTYNIWALPLLASNIGDRVEELPSVLHGYDVLLLQEAFASDVEGMLNTLASEYPYQTDVLDAPGFNLFNGGVVILSRYPIASTDFDIFEQCNGTECLADKGVVYAEIIRDGKAYHVTAAHTSAFDSDEARAQRQQQFQEIRALVDSKQPAAFDAVIMGGDFNVNKLKFPGDYQQMLTNLVAAAPVSTGYAGATYDPSINQNVDGDLSLGVEYLDYVFYSTTHRTPVSSRNDVRVPRSDSDDLWGIWDYSDHFPVLGEFQF